MKMVAVNSQRAQGWLDASRHFSIFPRGFPNKSPKQGPYQPVSVSTTMCIKLANLTTLENLAVMRKTFLGQPASCLIPPVEYNIQCNFLPHIKTDAK